MGGLPLTVTVVDVPLRPTYQVTLYQYTYKLTPQEYYRNPIEFLKVGSFQQVVEDVSFKAPLRTREGYYTTIFSYLISHIPSGSLRTPILLLLLIYPLSPPAEDFSEDLRVSPGIREVNYQLLSQEHISYTLLYKVPTLISHTPNVLVFTSTDTKEVNQEITIIKSTHTRPIQAP